MEKEQGINFGTKEENNKRRLQEALARTPHERFLFFLKMCEELQIFETGKTHPNRLKNNLLLE